jgi:hypothetical protein
VECKNILFAEDIVHENLVSITLLFEFVVLFVPLVSESYVVSKTERLFEKKKNSSFYFNIRLVLL